MSQKSPEEQSKTNHQELRVAHVWRIEKKIGGGSFGELYKGTHINTGNTVAVKLEKTASKFPQLLYESKLYNVLNDHHKESALGIPAVKWSGTEGDYNVLVMDMLGPSLEDLLNFCGRRFSLKTVLMLADQMINRIEFIHSKNFLHRDIKPDNFLMGTGRKGHIIYVIDFGLAKRYRDPKTHQHIQYKENKNLTGTARYSSINTHLGVEQSRRDDLEALGYLFVYFLKGSLPWQGLKGATKKQKYDKISEKKMATSAEMLCEGLPEEFGTFLKYTRSLKFQDKPDYKYLRRLMQKLFLKHNFELDFEFDWIIKKKEVEKSGNPFENLDSTLSQANQAL
eukprot:gb/GECH01014992.1/.p1 GENE.gb/GECH01014992.1/~~gb/GECH01014992.1/.p1  ORF type:complete len:338 (+),score=76.05 gb/GECH01014992.1/:1-1014(+)